MAASDFGGGHEPVVDLKHEDGHGGPVNFGIPVVVGAMRPVSVGGLGAANDLSKILGTVLRGILLAGP